jgi:hypothetical protein
MDFSKMTVYIKKIVKGNFFSKLVQQNSGYSSKSFFLVVVTFIGTLLLAVPIFSLTIEAWYNHTITTDLTAMAAYITAVAAVFTSVGLTKVWSEKYEHKLPGSDGKFGTNDDIIINVTDEEYNKILDVMNKQSNHQDGGWDGQGADNC